MSEYRYFGNSKRAYEFKECFECKEWSWITKEGTYCSNSCSRKNSKFKPKTFNGTITEYKKYHKRLYDTYGSAYKCFLGCNSKIYQWANLTGNYEDMQDYIQMCGSCHYRYDRYRLTIVS